MIRSSRDLYDAFRNGDISAFEELYKYYYPKLKRYGGLYCSDHTLIENCIQDFFVKMFRQPQSFSHVVNMDGYVYKSIKLRILSEIEKQKRRAIIRELAAEKQKSERPIEEAIIQKEGLATKIEWLKQQIDLLPTRQQEIIFLRFYEGYNYEKIAKITNLSNQVVRNYVARALTKIRTKNQTDTR